MSTTRNTAVALDDLRGPLALFARAFGASDPVLSARADASCASWPRPGTGGDRTQIVLPAAIDSFASARENRAAYRIAVMRQALAGARDAETHLAVATSGPLWRRVFHTLEWLRIDQAIARQYPGARDDLDRLRALALTQRALPGMRPLAAALDAMQRLALGQALAPPAGIADTWAAMAALAAPLAQPGATARDSAGTTRQILALLVAARPRRVAVAATAGPITHLAHDMLPAESALSPSAAASKEKSGHPPAAHRTASTAAGGTLLPGETQDVVGSHAALRRVPLPHRGGVSPLAADVAAASPADPTPNGRRYAIDEWDCHIQRHRMAWCTLYEQRLQGSDTGFLRGVRRRHAALAHEVHRRFAWLRPESLRRVHGADDGDELELDRVIEAHVDRRAGRSNDRAQYLRRDRAQRDVCAAFLIDTSASTDYVLRDRSAAAEPAPPPPVQTEAYLYDLAQAAAAAAPSAPPRRVIDVAKEAMALMCDALQVLGDPFAVYAFSGHGRAQVEFGVVKEFADAVSTRTAAALSALRPQGATRAGAAIRHTAAKLARQPQRSKLLILVTDGYPEDIDYGPEPREMRYAIEDTAHALREAQALGVSAFCLSIDPAGHDYLRRMCPPQRYGVIDDVAALPGELSKVYEALTRPWS